MPTPMPDRYDLADPAVRYYAPREEPEEHHCPPGCGHLQQARARGHEQGVREERERVAARYALVAPEWLIAAGLIAAALVWWARA